MCTVIQQLLILKTRLRRVEPAVLFTLLAIVVGIWATLGLLDAVQEGATESVDRFFLSLFRKNFDLSSPPRGPSWLREVVRDLSALGSPTVLLLFTAVGCTFLAVLRKVRLALLVALAVAGGWLVSNALKVWIGRPRPEVEALTVVHTLSFPSGHAMMSAVVYLTFASLTAPALPRVSLKLYWIGVAVVLTLCVGITRVYLGVHYPTDVLAGWSVGTVWALLCSLGLRRLVVRAAGEGAQLSQTE